MRLGTRCVYRSFHAKKHRHVSAITSNFCYAIIPGPIAWSYDKARDCSGEKFAHHSGVPSLMQVS